MGFLEKGILCIYITFSSDTIIGASSIRLIIILGPFNWVSECISLNFMFMLRRVNDERYSPGENIYTLQQIYLAYRAFTQLKREPRARNIKSSVLTLSRSTAAKAHARYDFKCFSTRAFHILYTGPLKRYDRNHKEAIIPSLQSDKGIYLYEKTKTKHPTDLSRQPLGEQIPEFGTTIYRLQDPPSNFLDQTTFHLEQTHLCRSLTLRPLLPSILLSQSRPGT